MAAERQLQADRQRGVRRRSRAASATFLLGAALLTGSAVPVGMGAAAAAGPRTTVIVRAQAGATGSVRAAVVRLGGRLGVDLPLVHGFTAEVPVSSIRSLSSVDGVTEVTEDGRVTLHSGGSGESWQPDVDLGSFDTVLASIDADDLHARSARKGGPVTGAGIGIALIDSGVVPVQGLTQPGTVVDGPDLSFESQDPGLAHLDSFGHGTHMAGIMVGHDSSTVTGAGKGFVGVAPGAHVINVKVAAADGAVDVSQVIAAVDWVVAHRNDPELNIRVLNLSFGTEALQSYQLDPLAFAVEQAWLAGIVVVVAAGNEGAAGTTLDNPATDPYVIAVGADDHQGTSKRSDDRLASFSSVGNSTRGPDVIAPGRSVVSLRAPGSLIDDENPAARVGDPAAPRFFRGSGTSQATAVVSGAVALLLQMRPTLTPDQVKYVLMTGTDRVRGTRLGQGAGLIDLEEVDHIKVNRAPVQKWARATGLGSLELARGGNHVVDPDGAELVGEFDIFGTPWDPTTWAAAAATQTSWVGGVWNGVTWTGDGWDASSWTGKTWRSIEWAGTSWSGKTWRDVSWSGKTWRVDGWAGKTWRVDGWAGKTWRSTVWAGARWRGQAWTGLVWR
jgi:serine protease AprX